MKQTNLAVLFAATMTTALAADAQVPYPEGYRDWHHVKSMVIEEGHPLYNAFGGIHLHKRNLRYLLEADDDIHDQSRPFR